MKKLLILLLIFTGQFGFSQIDPNAPKFFENGIKTQKIETDTIVGPVILKNAVIIEGAGNTYETDIFQIKNSDGTPGLTVRGNNTILTNAFGDYNEAIGYGAFGSADIDVGYANTAFGAYAMGAPDSAAVGNTAFGYSAMYYVGKKSSQNIAIGVEAMMNTGDSAVYNVAIGYSALESQGSVLTGTENTAIGAGSSKYTTTGDYNSSVGAASLQFNTTGDYNTAVGTSALRENTTGSGNMAVGASALRNNLEGRWNVALGISSLLNMTDGEGNIAIGANSGRNFISGDGNLFLGQAVLTGDETTGSNQVIISDGGGYRILVGNGITQDVEFFGQTMGNPAIKPEDFVVFEQMRDSIAASIGNIEMQNLQSVIDAGATAINTQQKLHLITENFRIDSTATFIMDDANFEIRNDQVYFYGDGGDGLGGREFHLKIEKSKFLLDSLDLKGDFINGLQYESSFETYSDSTLIDKRFGDANYIYTAGTGISITNNVISATGTTNNKMQIVASGDATVTFTGENITIVHKDTTDTAAEITIPTASNVPNGTTITLVPWSRNKGFSESYYSLSGTVVTHTGTEAFQVVKIQSDGTNWYQVSNY